MKIYCQFITILTLSLFANQFCYGQKFEDIESEIKKYSLLLESDMSTISNLLEKYEPDLKYEDDIVDNGELIHLYYDPKFGSLIYLRFKSSRFYADKRRACSQILVSFHYPTSQKDSFRDYLNLRSVFIKKNIGYYYQGSLNPIYDRLINQGYKMVFRFDESIDEKVKNKFCLTCSIELFKPD